MVKRALLKTVLVMVLAAGVAAIAVSCKSNTIDNATTNNSAGANVIGPQGGIVLGPEGSSVRIAQGALTQDTTIRISVVEPSQYPPLPSVTVLSKVYAFEPHGLKFLTPAILTLPFNAGAPTTGATGLRADPNGSWTEISAIASLDSAQMSTPSFSFYALASGADAGVSGPSCSGRGPDNTAPTGSLINAMGSYVSSTTPPYTVDAAKLVDGYAKHFSTVGAGEQVDIHFTDYARACGHLRNGIIKGGKTLTVHAFAASAITTQTYNSVGLDGFQQVITKTGPCSAPNGVSGGNGPDTVTITAIDATHVAGSFSFKADGTRTPSDLTGTFDVPICKATPNLQPRECCLP
jgi:hypothetical protein